MKRELTDKEKKAIEIISKMSPEQLLKTYVVYTAYIEIMNILKRADLIQNDNEVK